MRIPTQPLATDGIQADCERALHHLGGGPNGRDFRFGRVGEQPFEQVEPPCLPALQDPRALSRSASIRIDRASSTAGYRRTRSSRSIADTSLLIVAGVTRSAAASSVSERAPPNTSTESADARAGDDAHRLVFDPLPGGGGGSQPSGCRLRRGVSALDILG